MTVFDRKVDRMSVGTVAQATAGERHAAEREHLAQIYECDNALIESVDGYVQRGLSDGGIAIVIATRAHLAELERRWRDAEQDLDRLLAQRAC